MYVDIIQIKENMDKEKKMDKKSDVTIEDILYQSKKNKTTNNQELIRKAYEYAKEKHKNQLRKSGEPFIIHPIQVAYILAELGLDTSTICAALLHDVVEDTDSTYEEIKGIFNEEIAMLVEGVTKLTNLFKTSEEEQTENYKKMFLAMEKDIRLILLKLADRLHNITTLQHLSRDRQIAIAKETIELYSPIAHKLGMYDLKMKLQDGAFRYLYPEDYEKIKNQLNEIIEKNKQMLEKTKYIIEKELEKEKIIATLNIEVKHLYNIYKKINNKRITINQVKDLFAIKIITDKKRECYKILGIVNTIYNFVPGTFKDYIAIPRNNQYQAIHEILLGEKGIVFELQICTNKMNQIAKYGILNSLPHVEQDKRREEIKFEENLSGIHDSLEFEDMIENPKEFLSTLKTELLDDEIYIFTPKGKIQVLPKGATVIDFAYAIKEKLGNHMIGCKINSVDMPVITKLKNGDIVEIITSENIIHQQKEWLEIVKTAKAKKDILKLLKKDVGKVKEEKCIEIITEDRKNIVLEITKVLTKNDINIILLDTKKEQNKLMITIKIQIKENINFEEIISNLLQIENVKMIYENDQK